MLLLNNLKNTEEFIFKYIFLDLNFTLPLYMYVFNQILLIVSLIVKLTKQWLISTYLEKNQIRYYCFSHLLSPSLAEIT